MGGVPPHQGKVQGFWEQMFQSPGNPSTLTRPYQAALANAPGATPDITDKVVQAARASQSWTSALKQGRRTTFLSGPEGLGLSPPSVGTKTALGG